MDLCKLNQKLLTAFGKSERSGRKTANEIYAICTKEDFFGCVQDVKKIAKLLSACGFRKHAKKLIKLYTQPRSFHLGYVLTVIHNSLLHPAGMDGVYEILKFMTRDQIFTHQIPRALSECGPYLRKQYPQLATPDAELAITELREMLKNTESSEEKEFLVIGWLATQTIKYGEMLPITPLPDGVHEVKNPVIELRVLRS